VILQRGNPTGCRSGRGKYNDTAVHAPARSQCARGLGLSDDQVNDLADFIENGLYDPGFVQFDPKWPTKMFQLSPPDFLYSIYRPDLVAAGAATNHPAVDGRPLPGAGQQRRLDVTGR